jgi:hypothetical protein
VSWRLRGLGKCLALAEALLEHRLQQIAASAAKLKRP